jgi:hypothetical protein
MTKRSAFRTYELGDGWSIVAENRRTWTSYTAMKCSKDGYVIGGRSKEFCRRRDAEAWVREQRDIDEHARNQHAQGYLASDQH